MAAQHRPLSRPRVPQSCAHPGGLGSVRKAGRAVVHDEAAKFGGPRADIAATVQGSAFEYIDAPVGRIGAIRPATPESPPL